MICPILEVSFRIARPGDIPLDTECLQEECAWWDKVYGCCGELSKVKALRTLIDTGRIIAKELTLIRPPGK